MHNQISFKVFYWCHAHKNKLCSLIKSNKLQLGFFSIQLALDYLLKIIKEKFIDELRYTICIKLKHIRGSKGLRA